MPDLDNDIGRMTKGLWDNAKDVFDIWMHMPSRRADFGKREVLDIQETYLALGILLREIEKTKKPQLVTEGFRR